MSYDLLYLSFPDSMCVTLTTLLSSIFNILFFHIFSFFLLSSLQLQTIPHILHSIRFHLFSMKVFNASKYFSTYTPSYNYSLPTSPEIHVFPVFSLFDIILYKLPFPISYIHSVFLFLLKYLSSLQLLTVLHTYFYFLSGTFYLLSTIFIPALYTF